MYRRFARRPLFPALLLSFLYLAGCGRHHPSPEVQALDIQAHAYLQNNHFKEALPLCQQAVQLDPQDGEAHKNLALYYSDTGQNDAALPEAQAAVRLRPDFDKAYNVLGKALWGLGRLDESVAAYRKAIELNPKYSKAHMNLAVDLRDMGRSEEAITEYRKGIALEPDLANVYYQLGALLYSLHRDDEAMKVFQDGLKADAADATLHFSLGTLYARKSDLKHATEELKEAVRLQPTLYTAYEPLARLYEAQGLKDKAAQARSQLSQFALPIARDHYNRGTQLSQNGQYEAAIPELKKALELNPTYAWAFTNLGMAYRNLGRTDEAIATFRQGVRAVPNFGGSYANLGFELYKQGKHEEAHALWQKMLSLPDPLDVKDGRDLLTKYP